MKHPFLEALATALAGEEVATLRYNFPYTERGGKRPDRRPILLATVAAAVATARTLAPEVPLLAGGKSMGGRMTSLAAAEGLLDEDVRGIVFVGFPLHPARKPGVERADHLQRVALPLLFLQGTRDALAPLESLRPIVARLGTRATLHVLEGADHSFAVLRRSGRAPEGVLSELAREIAGFGDVSRSEPRSSAAKGAPP